VKIAVNNSFAYAALYKCGFAYTGENTGIAELVLERSAGEPARGGRRAEAGTGRDCAPSATATVTSIRRNGSSSQRDWGSAESGESGERKE